MVESMQTLLRKHKTINSAIFTTKTVTTQFELEGRTIRVMPIALYCYVVGKNITSSLDNIPAEQAVTTSVPAS
jgi:hypothetical protein